MRPTSSAGLLLLLTAALGLALAACGGGESSEDKITSTIEAAATSTDPAVCKETQTLKFMEQTTSSTGKSAEKQCEEQAKRGENNPESVGVSEIKVEGEKATANAEFKGGNFNGQTLSLALVEEEGEWKLNEMTGFAKFDPTQIVKALAAQLKKEASIEPKVASCIIEGVEGLPDEKLEELVISNNSQAVVKIAEACAAK